MQPIKNLNEVINWNKEFISKNNNTRYYENENFYNVEKIGKKIYRAKYKNSEQYFILKSLNLDHGIIKEELIHGYKLHSEVNFHKNLINIFGITGKENQDGQMKEYLLVMEYADDSSLRDYLKENFNNLTWEDKYEFAYQLACVVSFLHDKGIAHHDLYPGNIFFHQKTIKLANFGLLNRINSEVIQSCTLNEKNDVYSIGVLLWKISSGRPPFDNELYDANLIKKILQGYRETIVPDTPADYSNLYIECWNNEQDNRPTMNQVVDKLKTIITKTTTQLSNSNNKSDVNNCLLYGKLFHMINVVEIEPTTQNVHENIFEEDLRFVIDEFVNIYFKEINEGKEESVYNSNSITLLGCYYNLGIGTNIDMKKAFELYYKAVNLGNYDSQYHLALLYEYGNGIEKDINKAIYWYKKSAEQGFQSAQNKLESLQI
ncbi:hypothetical protein RclHR1_05750008 [Rhizophagus clarus]|uniref:Protein kinase domain-containing protein n=1 Tax=Rhizophagus clarus TaxID=94130 RepID=A0A2Z6RP37_9GLOM|nr:hypothetical protein RclHR1_05750008 [Rhizophagus clarus]